MSDKETNAILNPKPEENGKVWIVWKTDGISPLVGVVYPGKRSLLNKATAMKLVNEGRAKLEVEEAPAETDEEKAAKEAADVAAAEKEAAEQALIDEAIDTVAEYYEAAEITVADEEAENGETVLILLDENNEEIASGTLEELKAGMKSDDEQGNEDGEGKDPETDEETNAGEGKEAEKDGKSDKEEKPDLKAALDLLNPEDVAHWTQNGLPNLNVLKELTGTKVTRPDIDAIKEGFTRDVAAAEKAEAEKKEG